MNNILIKSNPILGTFYYDNTKDPAMLYKTKMGIAMDLQTTDDEIIRSLNSKCNTISNGIFTYTDGVVSLLGCKLTEKRFNTNGAALRTIAINYAIFGQQDSNDAFYRVRAFIPKICGITQPVINISYTKANDEYTVIAKYSSNKVQLSDTICVSYNYKIQFSPKSIKQIGSDYQAKTYDITSDKLNLYYVTCIESHSTVPINIKKHIDNIESIIKLLSIIYWDNIQYNKLECTDECGENPYWSRIETSIPPYDKSPHNTTLHISSSITPEIFSNWLNLLSRHKNRELIYKITNFISCSNARTRDALMNICIGFEGLWYLEIKNSDTKCRHERILNRIKDICNYIGMPDSQSTAIAENISCSYNGIKHADNEHSDVGMYTIFNVLRQSSIIFRLFICKLIGMKIDYGEVAKLLSGRSEED